MSDPPRGNIVHAGWCPHKDEPANVQPGGYCTTCTGTAQSAESVIADMQQIVREDLESEGWVSLCQDALSVMSEAAEVVDELLLAWLNAWPLDQEIHDRAVAMRARLETAKDARP